MHFPKYNTFIFPLEFKFISNNFSLICLFLLQIKLISQTIEKPKIRLKCSGILHSYFASIEFDL